MKNLIFTILALFALATSPAHAQLTSIGQQSIANLVPNGGFEQGRARWSTFSTTMTGTLPTGGLSNCTSCTLTMSATTSASLGVGKIGLSVTSSGATTSGHGIVSGIITLPSGLNGKSLSWSTQYQVASGLANMTFAGTSANTWQVYFFDVTNQKWVQPQLGLYSFIQGVGPGVASGTVQFDPSVTSVRIALMPINATTGATSMYFDDVAVRAAAPNTDGRATAFYVAGGGAGQSVGTSATKVTTWATPTSDSAAGWSAANNWYVISQSGYYQITAGIYLINPSVSINVIGQIVAGGVGYDIFNNPIATSQSIGYNGTVTVLLKAGDTVYATARTSTGTVTVGQFAQTFLNVARVPGPTSGDEGRPVVAQLVSNSSQTLAVSTFTQVTGFSVNGVDSHSGFATNSWIAPMAGVYRAKFSLFAGNTTSTGVGSLQCPIYKNGTSALNDIAGAGASAQASYRSCSTSGLLNLKAGDILTFYGYQDFASGGVALASPHNVSIERVSGPNVPQSQFDVPSLRVATSAGQSLTANTATLITFGTKLWDSTGAWSGNNAYYCPTAGKYAVSATAQLNAVTLTTGQTFFLTIWKNGSLYSQGLNIYGNGTAGFYMSTVTDDVNCGAGDYIQIYATSTSGGTLNATTATNYLTIKRVAN